MKVILLAGGLGTRLAEFTRSIPKPMVKIGRYPILIHIIKHYLDYGFNDFYLATGYKKNVIKKYFKNFKKENEQFFFRINSKNCKITIIDTGRKTMTGGRLKRIKRFLKPNEKFMFTYGDGISNVNLKKLLNFHNKQKTLITVTAVHPPARFGEITIKKNLVASFKEKPQTALGWINGGFFVSEYDFLNLINKDSDILEKNPLELACKKKKLSVYKHSGFWKCMDTIRDRDVLIKILNKKIFF